MKWRSPPSSVIVAFGGIGREVPVYIVVPSSSQLQGMETHPLQSLFVGKIEKTSYCASLVTDL